MVEQRGVEFPRNNDWSVPNHPNYRLKALVGSPCDTLRPIAAFSIDSLENTVFTDQSDRDPTSWFWTFGDGIGVSEAQNPVYSYTENGTYEVCLIATNEAGSDTLCQMVTILLTSTEELESVDFSVYPNPVDGLLHVDFSNRASRNWQLYNSLGQIIKNGNFSNLENQINLKSLSKGIYWLSVDKKQAVRIVVAH